MSGLAHPIPVVGPTPERAPLSREAFLALGDEEVAELTALAGKAARLAPRREE